MTIGTRAGRLRRDTWTMTLRELAHWIAQPAPVVINLLFPVLIVLMFGYLFGGAISAPGGSYREFLLPGMFAMTMLFGLETTLAGVVTDLTRGITDRFRSLPMDATAILLGRAVADMLNSAAGLAVIAACGLAVGWQPHRGAWSAIAAFGLLLPLRLATIWLGIYLGLLIKTPEAVTSAQVLVWPLGFLSSAFVDPATMPGWLAAIAYWNPLSATVTAARQLFGNPVAAGNCWAAHHPIVLAVAWPLTITAVMLPLTARRYRRLST